MGGDVVGDGPAGEPEGPAYGDDEGGEDPALAVLDGPPPALHILAEDGHAPVPVPGGGAVVVGGAPLAHHHTVVVIVVHHR